MQRVHQFPRWLVAALLVMALVASGQALVRVVKGSGALAGLTGPMRFLLGALSAAALLCVLNGLVQLLRSRRAVTMLDLRVAVLCAAFSSLLFPGVVYPYSYSGVVLWMGSLAALFSFWLGVESRHRIFRTGAARRLDVIVFNASLTVLLVQAGLTIGAAAFPTSLLAIPGNAETVLSSNRCEPGTHLFELPCNSRGYFGAEPEVAPGRRVVVIGDSFTVGVVPRPFLFTTVARHLSGVAVESLGIPGASPLEYQVMLREDALPLNPDAVVIALFAGNDVTESHLRRAGNGGQAWLRIWLDRDHNMLWTTARRLRRLGRELARGRPFQQISQPQGRVTNAGVSPERDSLAAAYPWLADYRLEEATFEWTNFLEVEQFRANSVCDPEDPAVYHEVLQDLSALKQLAGQRAFGVLIIPAQFQVEDALWKAVGAGSAVQLRRDLPQRRLAQWLEDNDVPYVDLLPAFRSVAPEVDGNRHLYHLQDTHLNARGNQVAGQHLASLIERLLAGKE